MEHECEILRARTARLEESYTTAQEAKQMLETEGSQLKQEIGSLRASIADLTQKLEDQALTMTVLQRSLRDTDKNSTATQAEAAAARHALSCAQAEHLEVCKAHEQTVSDLNEQLKEARDILRDAEMRHNGNAKALEERMRTLEEVCILMCLCI